MAEEVRIDIRSTADTSGIDKSGKALEGVAAAGGQTQKGLSESRAGFQAASAAASAATGSVQGVASALAQLAPRLQALNAALPVIGMVMAAFTAWKKAVDAVNESLGKQAAGLREITAGNIAAGIDTAAASYDRLRRSIDEAQQAQQDMLAGERALAIAMRDRELAEIELEKQKALAAESDPLKRRAIEAQAAARSAGISAAYGESEEARMAAMLEARRATARAGTEAAGAQEDMLARRVATAQRRLSEALEMQREAMDRALTPRGEERAARRYQQEIDALAASVKELSAQLRAARDERVAADAAARRIEVEIAAQAIAAQGRGIGRQAAVVATGAGVSQVQAEIEQRAAEQRAAAAMAAQKEAELAAKQAEARAQQERLAGMGLTARRESAEAAAAADVLVAAEAANVRRARPDRERVLAPYRETAGREEAEARAANVAFAAAKTEIGAMLSQLTADIKRLENEVKQARIRAGRSSVDVEAGP